mgnify:CR=1 FL=1
MTEFLNRISRFGGPVVLLEGVLMLLTQLEAVDRTSPARTLIDDLPLFAAAHAMFDSASGACPPCSKRVSMSFTGAPATFASRAHIRPSTPGENFAPKPPPMCSQITRTLSGGRSNASATVSRSIIRTICRAFRSLRRSRK